MEAVIENVFTTFTGFLSQCNSQQNHIQDEIQNNQQQIESDIYDFQALSQKRKLIRQNLYELSNQIEFVKNKKNKQVDPNIRKIYINEQQWESLFKNKEFIKFFTILFEFHLIEQNSTQMKDEKKTITNTKLLFNNALTKLLQNYMCELATSIEKTQNQVLFESLIFNASESKKVQLISFFSNRNDFFIKIYSEAVEFLLNTQKNYQSKNNNHLNEKITTMIKILQFFFKQVWEGQHLDIIQNIFTIIVEKIKIYESIQGYQNFFQKKNFLVKLDEKSSNHPLISLILLFFDDSTENDEHLIDGVSFLSKDYQHHLKLFFRRILQQISNLQSTRNSMLEDFLNIFITQILDSLLTDDKLFLTKGFFVNILILEITNTINNLSSQKNLSLTMKNKFLALIELLINNMIKVGVKMNETLILFDIQLEYKGIETQFQQQIEDNSQQIVEELLIINKQTLKQYSIKIPQILTSTECKQSLIESLNKNDKYLQVLNILQYNCVKQKCEKVNLIYEYVRINVENDEKSKQSKKKKMTTVKLNQDLVENIQLSIEEYCRDNQDHEQEILQMYCSMITNQRLPQAMKIGLMLLQAFLDDSTISIRLRILEIIEKCIYQLDLYNFDRCLDFLSQKQYVNLVHQRLLDTNKSIRMKSIEIIFKHIVSNQLNEYKQQLLESIFQRFNDIDPQVRLQVLKTLKVHLGWIKAQDSQFQRRIFQEIGQRLEDTEEISEYSAILIKDYLTQSKTIHVNQSKKGRKSDINDTQSRGITNKLIELTSLNNQESQLNNQKVQILLQKLILIQDRSFQLVSLFKNSIELIIIDAKAHILSLENSAENEIYPKLYEKLNFILLLISITEKQSNRGNLDLQGLKKESMQYIDQLLEIFIYQLQYQTKKVFTQDNLTNMINLLIFCFDHQMTTMITLKLKNNISKTAELLEVLTMTGVYDYSFSKPALQLYALLQVFQGKADALFLKLQTSIKLVTTKFLKFEDSNFQIMETNDVSVFELSLVIFQQFFGKMEFLNKELEGINKDFFIQTLIPFYNILLEITTVKEMQLFQLKLFDCIRVIWQKIPQLIFGSQEFIKKCLNYQENYFDEQMVHEVYSMFLSRINQANDQALLQSKIIEIADDYQKEVYMIKQIFTQSFEKHLNSRNRKIKFIVLNLLNSLFDNQMLAALEFGPQLIESYFDSDEQIKEVALNILLKCFQLNFKHMQISFEQYLPIYFSDQTKISHNNQFSELDLKIKNITEGQLKQNLMEIPNNPKILNQKILSEQLCQHLKRELNSFNNYNKIKNILDQITNFKYISQSEILVLLSTTLQNFDEQLGKIGTRLQKLKNENDELKNNLDLPKSQQNQTLFDLEMTVEQSLALLIRLLYSIKQIQKYYIVVKTLNDFIGKNDSQDKSIMTLEYIHQKVQVKLRKQKKVDVSFNYFKFDSDTPVQNLIQQSHYFLINQEWKQIMPSVNYQIPYQNQVFSDSEQEQDQDNQIDSKKQIKINQIELEKQIILYCELILDKCEVIYRDIKLYDLMENSTLLKQHLIELNILSEVSNVVEQDVEMKNDQIDFEKKKNRSSTLFNHKRNKKQAQKRVQSLKQPQRKQRDENSEESSYDTEFKANIRKKKSNLKKKTLI